MEVDLIVVIKILAIALVHWILAPIALRKLTEEKTVIGGRKTPWALAVIFLTCIGPLMFLILNLCYSRQPETQTEVQ